MPKSNAEGVYNRSLIRFAEVLQIEDKLSTASTNEISKNSFGRRIKVRLIEDKQNLNPNDLPWAFPLLPKHLQITPKIGEMVLVFMESLDGPLGNRFYIGPIISQDYFLNHGGKYEALSLLQGVSTSPLTHPSGNPKNEGSYPNSDTIAIQGRGNAAMWIMDEEMRILCGHKPNWANKSVRDRVDTGALEFNKRSLSYIKMKYGQFKEKSKIDGKIKEFNSVINLVADRIHLITHDGTMKKSYLDVTDTGDLMKDEVIEKFASDGEKLVFGNELVQFLNRFRQVFGDHVHHWSNDKQVQTEKDSDFWGKDLNELLCKTISIA